MGIYLEKSDNMLFAIEYCRANAIENAPFKISRKDGSARYIFFHFSSQVVIKISDDEEIVCSPGTCVLFEPSVYQYFYVENNRLNHDYIDFDLSDDSFFKKIHFPLNKPLNFKNSKYVNEMISNIEKEFNGIEIGNKYRCQSLMLELFVSISRKYHNRKAYSNEKYINLQKTKFEEIRLNIYQSPDELKISMITKEMGYSASRFNELYKKFFNCTPIEDLTLARISRVKDLIVEGYPTKEIIRLLGFKSNEYFYRWFKQNFKMTINEYKQERKEEIKNDEI